jgi:hypothetical protein
MFWKRQTVHAFGGGCHDLSTGDGKVLMIPLSFFQFSNRLRASLKSHIPLCGGLLDFLPCY